MWEVSGIDVADLMALQEGYSDLIRQEIPAGGEG